MKKMSIIVFIISMMLAFTGFNDANASVVDTQSIALLADEDPDKDKKKDCCKDKKEGECCKDTKSKKAECEHKKPCEGHASAAKAEKKDCKSSSCDDKNKKE